MNYVFKRSSNANLAVDDQCTRALFILSILDVLGMIQNGLS